MSKQSKIQELTQSITNKINSLIGGHDANSSAHSTLFNTKANYADLGLVATSNDYNDLDNIPISDHIPYAEVTTFTSNTFSVTVNGLSIEDGTLVLLKNATGAANSSTVYLEVNEVKGRVRFINTSALQAEGWESNAIALFLWTNNSWVKLTTQTMYLAQSDFITAADTLGGSIGSGNRVARYNHSHPKSSLYAEANHTHSYNDLTNKPFSNTLSLTFTYEDDTEEDFDFIIE